VRIKSKRRKSLDAIKFEGLAQTHDYMDRCGADEGYLVIFDRRPGISWDERIYRESANYEGDAIEVWGM